MSQRIANTGIDPQNPHWQPETPTDDEINAPAPYLGVKGGAVVLTVNGKTTALTNDDITRLQKQLAQASQLQTGAH